MLKKDVLIGVQNQIADAIEIGSYGVYMTDSKSGNNVYEIIRWESEPYTEQISENDKDISEKVEVKDTDNENSDQEEIQPEQESVVRKDRPTILESFKDKLTEFLDNAE